MDHLSKIRTGAIVKARPPVGAPPGTRATSLVDDVRTMTVSGPTDPLAAGARPDPGPLPATPAPAGVDDLRAQPIRFQFPYAINQFVTPRGGGLTPFDTLRRFADVFDVARVCIETRKDQICSLQWDVALKDAKGKPTPALQRKLDDVRAFLFGKPDKRRDFATWLRMAIEEVLVIDALAIYKRRTRGGDLYALEIKDGSTIKPLLDASGDTPMPPFVAYRQIIYGRPVQGGDCSADELIYRPRTVRSHTPYGLSPTEAILLTVNAALNRQIFNLQYYAEGNVPEGLISAPENWTPQQISDFQQYFDAMLAGDLAQRRRLKIVGKGMADKVYEFKEATFDTAYDEWLMRIACAAYAVPPQEIGFTQDVNRATGQMQENVVYRRGVKPLAGFLKSILDDVLATDLGAPEIAAVFNGGETEDALVRAQTDAVYVNMGKVSVDELRIRDGDEPIGLGPFVMTPTGPIFVSELVASVDDDPDTTDLGDDSVNPTDPDAADTQGPAGGDATISDQELKKWRRVAIQCVKRGQPVRAFRADHLSVPLHTSIAKALSGVTTVAGVVSVFDRVEKGHTLAGKLRRAENGLRRKTATFFRDQGKALADHVSAKIAEAGS